MSDHRSLGLIPSAAAASFGVSSKRVIGARTIRSAAGIESVGVSSRVSAAIASPFLSGHGGIGSEPVENPLADVKHSLAFASETKLPGVSGFVKRSTGYAE